MEIIINKEWCNVIAKDGYQYITMPDGTIIPGQVMSCVTTEVDVIPVAIVKLFVNVLENK